jgi:hypothetical protein
MKKIFRVSKSSAAFVWHAKHVITHLIIGVGWFFLLEHFYPDLPANYFYVALIASILPDLEHIYFLLVKKPTSGYTKEIMGLMKQGRIVELFRFVEKKHKYETFLPFHHIITPLIALIGCAIAIHIDRFGTAVFCGAFTLHYVFDIVEDVILLRKLNPNWTASLISKNRQKS